MHVSYNSDLVESPGNSWKNWKSHCVCTSARPGRKRWVGLQTGKEPAIKERSSTLSLRSLLVRFVTLRCDINHRCVWYNADIPFKQTALDYMCKQGVPVALIGLDVRFFQTHLSLETDIEQTPQNFDLFVGEDDRVILGFNVGTVSHDLTPSHKSSLSSNDYDDEGWKVHQSLCDKVSKPFLCSCFAWLHIVSPLWRL